MEKNLKDLEYDNVGEGHVVGGGGAGECEVGALHRGIAMVGRVGGVGMRDSVSSVII